VPGALAQSVGGKVVDTRQPGGNPSVLLRQNVFPYALTT
jgi:hypothetical protein